MAQLPDPLLPDVKVGKDAKYIGYDIVRAICRAPMEREVLKMMAKGWIPIGGVQVVIDKKRAKKDPMYRECFYQAMVLPAPAETPNA